MMLFWLSEKESVQKKIHLSFSSQMKRFSYNSFNNLWFMHQMKWKVIRNLPVDFSGKKNYAQKVFANY